jgi:acyl-coenzyme A thioesterase PaaI-like protein
MKHGPDATGNDHDGVLASLADVAGTLACIVDGAKPFATMHMNINFLKSPGCWSSIEPVLQG